MNVIRLQPLFEHAEYCRTCKASRRQTKRTQHSFPWCNTTFGHTVSLIYHDTSLSHRNLNWENWKDCIKLLYHSHHKLIHFRALILIFETSLELWLGSQGYTPFFCNASLHHRSCYKQYVRRCKTFRLAEGKSTTSSVVSRQLHTEEKVTQNLPNYSSKELPKSYYKNIFLAVASSRSKYVLEAGDKCL